MGHDGVEVTVGLLVLLAAALKLLQLRRAKPDTNRPAVIAMCGAIAAIGLAALQETHVVVGLLDARLGVHLAYAERHTPALVSFACLPVAFLCWVRPPGRARRRRLVLHAAVLAAVLALRWALAAASNPADAAAGLAGDWPHAPWTAAAVALYVGYTAATVATVTVLALRWSRAVRTQRPWTAVGLRLMVGAGAGFGLYLAHKIVFMVVVLVLGAPPYDPLAVEWPILLVAVLLLAAGLSTPLVATLVRRVAQHARQRVAYGRLGPLWAALTGHNPDVVMPIASPWLPAPLAGLWDLVDPREVPFRLYRRTIECWDVLAGLHGHLDSRVRDEALAAARVARPGVAEDEARAVATAVMIRAALERASAQDAPVSEERRAAPPSHHGELGDNVVWWQRVAGAWDDPLTVRLAA